MCARFKSTFDLQHLDAKSELHFTCSMCALFCFGLQFLLRSFMGSCTCLESLLIDFAFGRRFDGKLHHSVHALNDICRQLNNKLPERSITCLCICSPLCKQQTAFKLLNQQTRLKQQTAFKLHREVDHLPEYMLAVVQTATVFKPFNCVYVYARLCADVHRTGPGCPRARKGCYLQGVLRLRTN